MQDIEAKHPGVYIMITIINAQVYSINDTSEMAYEIEYSEGTKVRAVEGAGIIRKEVKLQDGWKLVGKSYIVSKNNTRVAERIKMSVRKFLEGV